VTQSVSKDRQLSADVADITVSNDHNDHTDISLPTTSVAATEHESHDEPSDTVDGDLADTVDNVTHSPSDVTAVVNVRTLPLLRLHSFLLWVDADGQGRFYIGAGGHVPPRFTCCPQIQKLADRSDVISELQNAANPNFLGLCPRLHWEALADGKAACCLSQVPHRRSRPSFIRVSGSNPLQSWQPY